MKRWLFIPVIFFNIFFAKAQPTEIPETIYFAGIKLNLSRGLRSELLRQVLAMTKNKTYYQSKVGRADTYFPIIERVFEEEGVPIDFKYLAIQESSLMPNVVSSSQAVGYWQFKRESAVEMGLYINGTVDERKHIVESSRAAAKYIKKNYLLLTNWVYALISYQTGFGGVKNIINKKYIGASEMDLDTDTYWYAIKFLAHKLAYEDKVGYNHQPDISILEYSTETRGKTLAEIAVVTQINEEKLKEYNSWLLMSHIPDNKDFTVLLPVTYMERDQVAAKLGIEAVKKPVKHVANEPVQSNNFTPRPVPDSKILANRYDGIPLLVTNNGLDAVIAKEGDNAAKLAFLGRISINRFRQYNDLQKFEEARKGQIYYFEPKNNKGIILFHSVKKGENLWDISQNYGMKMSQLIKKNRIEDAEAIQEGRILYLRNKRPENEPIMYTERQAVQKPVIDEKKAISLPKNDSVKITPLKDSIATTKSVQKYTDKTGINMKKREVIPVSVLRILGKNDPLPDSSLSYHLVNQGQTLYSLSKYYTIKVDTLKAWNSIGVEGVKFAQKIIVSKNKNSLKIGFMHYQVKNNQDFTALLKDIGVSKENILNWNGKKEGIVLPGELIKIKNTR